MLKKTLLLAASLLFLTAGTAAAQDAYPPAAGPDAITANDTTVAPGGAMVLGIQVCNAGATATFTLDNSTALGSGTASSAGLAQATVTIPSSTSAGTHTITGSCADGAGTLTQVLSFTVTAAAGGAALPTTGSGTTTPMTQMAIAAIAGGGLLVLLANKRRSAGRAEQRETAGV